MTADRATRGLVRTLVATSLVTIALGALLTWPRARLQPVRAVPFELDEPWERTPDRVSPRPEPTENRMTHSEIR